MFFFQMVIQKIVVNRLHTHISHGTENGKASNKISGLDVIVARIWTTTSVVLVKESCQEPLSMETKDLHIHHRSNGAISVRILIFPLSQI